MAPYESKYTQFKADIAQYIESENIGSYIWEPKLYTLFIEEEYYLDRDHENNSYPIHEIYDKMLKSSKRRYQSLINSIFWKCCIHLFILVILAIGTYTSRESPVQHFASILATGIHFFAAINDVFVQTHFDYMTWKRIISVLNRFKNDHKNK